MIVSGKFKLFYLKTIKHRLMRGKIPETFRTPSAMLPSMDAALYRDQSRSSVILSPVVLYRYSVTV